MTFGVTPPNSENCGVLSGVAENGLILALDGSFPTYAAEMQTKIDPNGNVHFYATNPKGLCTPTRIYT